MDKKNHNPAPLIVVLAGNNRTGAYSLGAGRWLSIRGIRVLGVICTTEGEELEVSSPLYSYTKSRSSAHNPNYSKPQAED